MSIDIVLADDHPIILDELRHILTAQPDFRVVGAVDNGLDAVDQVTRFEPEIAIFDIMMPRLNGFEATLEIKRRNLKTRVIVLSIHDTKQHILHAFEAGAQGYVLKESPSSDVIQAVCIVYDGRLYVSQNIAERLFGGEPFEDQLTKSTSFLSQLNYHERRIMHLVVEGKSNAEIAKILHLSPATVATYRSHLMRKLDLPDLPSLVKFAILHGLTSLE